MVHLNMNGYKKDIRSQLQEVGYDITISDLGLMETCYNKLIREQEVECDYAWLLEIVIENKKDDIRKVQNKKENENKDENETEAETEDEDDDEDEGVHIDENNKDPDYCLFLENLTEHGKSYKLLISQNDEEPRFLYYEEQDNSDCCKDLQICTDDSEDEVIVSEEMQIKQKAKRKLNKKSGQIYTKKEVSKKQKIDDNNITDKCKEEPVEYEKNVSMGYAKNVTMADADSDVLILNNVQNCSEVNNKQLVLAEKEPSLREKLMCILELPYDEKEYKELSEYIEEEKPVCQLRPLRNGRSRAFAEAGVNRSVLDYGPDRFRRMLKAAKKDPPKALNLLRMFRFWLEHVPNDDVFQPWRDEHILNVRPIEKNDPTHMQQKQLLLFEDK